jgi:transcription antitermination protein NusB
MKIRHRAREVALQILYRYDANITMAQQLLSNDGNSLSQDLVRHFDHFDVPEPAREFAAELVAGTLGQLTQLDELLEKHAVNWKVTRMGSIDRALLRMAAYELLNFPDIPLQVTIDEAVELSKQFGTTDSPAFVNGVLDAIAKEKPEKSAG